MIKIFIVGTGNLGTHLCRWFDDGGDLAFAKAENPQKPRAFQLVGYLNKNGARLDHVTALRIENYKDIPPADLVLIAVPDDAVENVSKNLPKTAAVVAHTSGSVSMEVLSHHKNYGVFYLPQSFSKSRRPDFSSIPICLEYSNAKSHEVLKTSAELLSSHIHLMNSAQRKHLHLAAVYMNNFVNHCYLKSQQILEEAGIDPSVLNPLMRETLSKAIELQPKNAQTGPAKRNDQNTIATHLDLLPEEERELYKSITHSILKEYRK